MEELREIVQELIMRTREGEFKWTPWNESLVWSVEYNSCGFWVHSYTDQLEFAPSMDSGLILSLGSGEVVHPLCEVLDRMYPFKKMYTKDRAIQAASECLSIWIR